MAGKSISKIALRAMSIRLFIVVLLVSLAGSWHIYNVIVDRTKVELAKYVKERVERESLNFALAQKNLELFDVTFQKRLALYEGDFDKEFQQKFELLANGTYAARPYENDELRPIQMFLKQGVIVTPLMKKTMVILHGLIAQFGYAWSANFTNLWLSGIDDFGLTYWPSRPMALANLPADHSFLIHEYMTIGLPVNNPLGEPRWTGPYFDVMSKDWMISLNHPISHEGKYLISVGLDILLNDFNERSISNTLEGTQNIIFRNDGRLITHPDYMEAIKRAEGNLLIQKQNDPILRDIFQLVNAKTENKVIFDEKNNLFLGIGKVKGPGWWFVIVYPQKKVMVAAKEAAIFLAIIGLISLIIELLMLFQVLQRYVALPIKKLIVASNRIADGDREARVVIKTDDEIGHLGRSFNVMSERVQERDSLLSEQAARLEVQVQERTSELDSQRAKAFHASKMATLGEISGGVAHEINNPLGTITLSAGVLRRRLQKNEISVDEIYPYLDKIETTSQRISKIVKGLRAFSRNADQDKMENVPIKSIIENTLALCEMTLKKNAVTLGCDTIPECDVVCREVEITQTLLNLIQNSIDALEKQDVKRIRIFFKDEPKWMSLIVEDNGHGIPVEILDRIMNPFFTTKDVGKGTGLGLFISCGLVESNGGKLTVEPRPGSTCFIIRLKKG